MFGNEISVKIDKAVLEEKLTQNLEQHKTIYSEAIAGWKVAALESIQTQFESLKDKIESLKPTGNVYFTLPTRPENHSDDYESVLAMLAYAQDTTIELSREDFQAFVQDNWGWKADFIGTSSTYTSSR